MPVPLQLQPVAALPPFVHDHTLRGRPIQAGPAQHSHLQAPRSLSRDHGSPRRQSALANGISDSDQSKTNMQKAKDLSHVPCKFFKANSCTAGASCPFSHDMTQPGTSKPLCQWFAKGNCKFGHKCALAHILPGQPMSYDRKNKRAAQTALREAQAQAVNAVQAASLGDGSILGTSPSTREAVSFSNLPQTQQSGLARSLHNTADVHAATATAARMPDWTHAQQAFSNDGSGGEGHFGSPPLFDPVQPPLSFGTLRQQQQQQTATFLPAPSALSQTLQHVNASSNGGNRSSMAAQLMLGEQARRLSSTSETLSPPRLHAQSRHPSYMSTSSSSAAGGLSDMRTSPRASPAAIFGTSPFQGSRGLFMPSSVDSNEDFFGRSPPARNGGLMTDMRRSLSNGWAGALGSAGGGGDSSADEFAIDAREDDQDDDDYDEAFLPSSLNDLLTPEEQHRRASKVDSRPNDLVASFMTVRSSHQGAGAGTGAQGMASQSVPADMSLLARGAPVVSSSRPALSITSISSSSIEGTNPRAASFTPSSPPVVSASPSSVGVNSLHLHSRLSLRSSGFSATSSLSHPTFVSSSFDSRLLPPLVGGTDIANGKADGFDFSSNQTGSLPGGLAAGLSQLHLTKANYTGDTPPCSTSSAASANGSSPAFSNNNNHVGNGVSASTSSVVNSTGTLPWNVGWEVENQSQRMMDGTSPNLSSSSSPSSTTFLRRSSGAGGGAGMLAKSPLSHVAVFGGSTLIASRELEQAQDEVMDGDEEGLNGVQDQDLNRNRKIRDRTLTITAKLDANVDVSGGDGSEKQANNGSRVAVGTGSASVASGESDVEDIQFTMDA
ncbi:hypothetical protein ACM66B_004683 [Microbotryomycetes sp. NB124-2]